ncbi:TolC family protein [Veronia pacifica]|uniref:TolC family protein n=1 Tax=Veronia pacifica TaxID=1080227 RepID=A0A1C3EJ71_9GAMM|nr:TolC family protein [Veronia pacifica]ODA33274.1 hypothetical protein A8L45_10755 [Veronia pacifica]
MSNTNLATVCGFFLLSLSFNADAYSIEQAWKEAKKNDPELASAGIVAQKGELSVKASKQQLMPSADLNVRGDWSENQNSQYANVSLSQSLWDSQLYTGVEQAKADSERAKINRDNALSLLGKRLLNAYFELALAQSEHRLATVEFEDAQSLEQIVSRAYQAGRNKSVDVDDARLNTLNDSSRVLDASSNLEQKKIVLAALTQVMPKDIDELNPKAVDVPAALGHNLDDWLGMATESGYALKLARQQVAAKALDRQRAKEGYQPKVTASIGYAISDVNRDGEATASLSLNLPFDLNGQIKSGVEAASLDELDAKQQVRKEEQRLTSSIRQQFSQLKNSEEKLAIEELRVNQQMTLLESKKRLYDSGLLTLSDLIEEQDKLFSTRTDLEKQRYSVWQNRVELLYTSGGLNEDAVALIAKAFD